eukprot:6492141-Amphidinium_carterae.3
MSSSAKKRVADSPEVATKKGRTQCCACCKKKITTANAWGTEKDKCSECGELWTSAFCYMSWPDYIKMGSTADGKTLLAQAKDYKDNPESRPFRLQTADQKQACSAILQQSFVVMDEKEYLKHFKNTHKVKDPKVTQVTFETAGGTEQLFVFKNPAQPHRLLLLTSSMEESKTTQVMTSDEHLHEDAGQEHYLASMQGRLQDTKQGELLNAAGRKYLCTVDEYEHKLAAKYGKQEGIIADAGEDEDEDKDEDDDDAGTDDEQTVQQLAMHPPSKGVKKVVSSSASMSGAQKASDGGKTPAKAKWGGITRKGSANLVSPPSKGEAASLHDGGSVAGTVVSKSQRKKMDREEIAHEWVAKLPLQAILNGAKLGVQVHQAWLHYNNKMGEVDGLFLSTHLQLCQHCLTLAPEGLIKATSDAIRNAIEALSKESISWPTPLQEDLWKRLAKHATDLISPTELLAEEKVQRLLATCLPYSPQMQALDMFNPTLAAIEMEMSLKGLQFQRVILEDVLVNKILAGETGKVCVQRFSEFVAKQLAKDLASLDLDDSYVASVMEVQDVMLALQSLLADDVDMMIEHCGLVDDLALYSKRGKTKYLKDVGNAVTTNPWWSSTLQRYSHDTKSLKAHASEIQVVNAFWSNFQVVDAAIDLQTIVAKLHAMNVLQDDIPKKVWDEMNVKAESCIKSQWQTLEGTLGQENTPNVKDIQDFVMTASSTYPCEEMWSEAQLRVATYITTMNTGAKVTALTKAFSELAEGLGKTEVDAKNLSEQVLSAIAECEGLTAPVESHATIFHQWKSCSEWVLSNWSKDFVGVKAVVDTLRGMLLPCGSPNVQSKESGIMAKAVQMQVALDHLKERERAKPFFEENDDKKSLRILMAHSISLAQATEWGDSIVQPLLQLAKTKIEEASKATCGAVGAELDRAIAELAPMKGGLEGGESWKDGLELDTWDAFKNNAAERLGQVQTKLLKGKLLAIEQVSLGRQPRNALASYESTLEFYSVQPDDQRARAKHALAEGWSTCFECLVFSALCKLQDKVLLRKSCQALLKESESKGCTLHAVLHERAAKAMVGK